jgi:glycosyltransferase involved in cell wall biosynthesis
VPSTDRRPRRIAMVAASNYESDPRVRRQAEALAARGDEVTVVALHSEGRPREEILDGVRVVRVRTRKFRGASGSAYLKLYADFGVRAAAWLARRPRRFDLIQAHSMPEVLVLCGAVQKMLGVPLLLDVHDMTSRLFESKFGTGRIVSAVRSSEVASMAFATEVITVHEPYAELLRARTKRTVTSVLNSPDERLFTPRRWRSWDVDGEIVFSYHGTIAPRHGLLTLVEALADVRVEIPGARLLVRGGGDGLAPAIARAVELGVTDAVDFPDRVYPVSDMPAQIDRVHIGVAPNALDVWTADVLPTKVLEYAEMGIPSISFRNPVMERYFPDDAVSYVDPASRENLRAAMLGLARDPDRARKQADRAAEVMSDLSWAKQKEIYLGVVDRLTARG